MTRLKSRYGRWALNDVEFVVYSDPMTKLIFKLLAVVHLALFVSGCASSETVKEKPQLAYPYSRLKVMDLDQMTDIMYQQAKAFKKTDDPKVLQDGLLICLSRPNEDGQIEKVLSIVRTPMEDNDVWESSVESLVDTAITTMKNKTSNAADQVTYGIVLENIVSEFKPVFVKQYKSPGFETKIIEKIAEADIELSQAAISERKLNLMRGNISPSLFAKKMIERRDEVLKK